MSQTKLRTTVDGDKARAVSGLLAAWRSRAESRPCPRSLCPGLGRAAIIKPAPATENNVVMKRLKKKKATPTPQNSTLSILLAAAICKGDSWP